MQNEGLGRVFTLVYIAISKPTGINMGSEAVRLQNVSKTYGKVLAVNRVSLAVQQGEFFTLLGASGSGKTTLLQLIGGFQIPDAGCIWIGGEDVSRLPAYRRNVHTVFQDYALFPHMSVFENVGYCLLYTSPSPRDS